MTARIYYISLVMWHNIFDRLSRSVEKRYGSLLLINLML